MTSKWTHVVCGTCYDKMYPGREPARLRDVTEERCCFCDGPTNEGIFVRADPNETLCKGDHSN